MKKIIRFSFFALLFLTLSSFSLHKFYISIYQIEYAPEKKMLQITSRIFIDDLNTVLEKKYGKKTHLGEKNETAEDVELMNKYILDKFSIVVNGQLKPIHFLSKELEGNVIIVYYNIKNIPKINTLEVQNTVLMDLFSEQQNIIQSKIYNVKQSLLLTVDNVKGTLK